MEQITKVKLNDICYDTELQVNPLSRRAAAAPAAAAAAAAPAAPAGVPAFPVQ